MSEYDVIKESVERACCNLPEGFIVALCMENGSAFVQLIDTTGREVIAEEIDECLDLSEMIDTAVDVAIKIRNNR